MSKCYPALDAFDERNGGSPWPWPAISHAMPTQDRIEVIVRRYAVCNRLSFRQKYVARDFVNHANRLVLKVQIEIEFDLRTNRAKFMPCSISTAR